MAMAMVKTKTLAVTPNEARRHITSSVCFFDAGRLPALAAELG